MASWFRASGVHSPLEAIGLFKLRFMTWNHIAGLLLLLAMIAAIFTLEFLWSLPFFRRLSLKRILIVVVTAIFLTAFYFILLGAAGCTNVALVIGLLALLVATAVILSRSHLWSLRCSYQIIIPMGSVAGLSLIAYFVRRSPWPFEMYCLVPALLIALLMSLGIMTAATRGRGFAFVTGLLSLVYAALVVTAGLLTLSIFTAAHFTMMYEKLWGDYGRFDSLWAPDGRLARMATLVDFDHVVNRDGHHLGDCYRDIDFRQSDQDRVAHETIAHVGE